MIAFSPRSPAVRRIRRVSLALIMLLGLLAACSRGASVSEVTVTVGSASVTLPAAMSCISPSGSTELSCAGGESDSDAPHLAISPGTPLTVDVPRKVGDTPWVVVFSYVDAAGETQGDRTTVFSPGAHYSYRLTPPAGAQLTRVEVQSLTAAPATDGGVEFPAVGTWVLIVDPVGDAAPSSRTSDQQE